MMHGQPYIKIQNNISYNSFNRFQIPKSRRTGRHTKGNRRIFCIFALFAMRKKKIVLCHYFSEDDIVPFLSPLK